MVSVKDKSLQPPIHRSWLRLRLGRVYYASKRYLLWLHPSFRWAKTRGKVRFP